MTQVTINQEQVKATENTPIQDDVLELRLAKELKDCTRHITGFPIPGRLRKLKQFFQLAYNHFDDATKTQVTVSSTSEWLLDNFYVLE
jgi:hypothetical protein